MSLELFNKEVNTHGTYSGCYRELVGTKQPPAWRVACRYPDGFLGVLPMLFGRRRDAELAKRALEANGLSTRETLVKAGRDHFERVMIEALDW